MDTPLPDSATSGGGNPTDGSALLTDGRGGTRGPYVLGPHGCGNRQSSPVARGWPCRAHLAIRPSRGSPSSTLASPARYHSPSISSRRSVGSRGFFARIRRSTRTRCRADHPKRVTARQVSAPVTTIGFGGRAGGVAHVHQPLGTPTRRAVGTVASVSGRVAVGPYVRLTPRSPSRAVNIGHGGRQSPAAIRPAMQRDNMSHRVRARRRRTSAAPLAHIVVFHVKHLPRVPRWPPSHSPCTRHRRRGDRRPTVPLRPARFSSQRQRDRQRVRASVRPQCSSAPLASNRRAYAAPQQPNSIWGSAPLCQLLCNSTGQRTPHAQPMFHVKPRRADGLPAHIDPGARPDPRAHRTRSDLGED